MDTYTKPTAENKILRTDMLGQVGGCWGYGLIRPPIYGWKAKECLQMVMFIEKLLAQNVNKVTYHHLNKSLLTKAYSRISCMPQK